MLSVSTPPFPFQEPWRESFKLARRRLKKLLLTTAGAVCIGVLIVAGGVFVHLDVHHKMVCGLAVVPPWGLAALATHCWYRWKRRDLSLRQRVEEMRKLNSLINDSLRGDEITLPEIQPTVLKKKTGRYWVVYKSNDLGYSVADAESRFVSNVVEKIRHNQASVPGGPAALPMERSAGFPVA